MPCVLLVIALLPGAPAFAQAEAFVALIPTELTLGVGSALEWDPGQASTAVNFGLSRAWVRDQWIEPALEMGLGPWSTEARCPSEDLSESEFLGSDIAIQGGGGVDLRKPTSIHGVRFSADYRRVFAAERGRHQVQILVSYFVGWRGAQPGGAP